MDIPINAKVNFSDGPCGRSTHIIIMPATEQITHLVVSDEALPKTTRYLVPIIHVIKSTPESIQLNCTRNQLSKMPVFDQMKFIPSGVNDFSETATINLPYYPPERIFTRLEKEYVPANELVIWKGAGVEAMDCHAGRVEAFMIDPQNDRITHLVLRGGYLGGRKTISVPVSQIDHYQEDAVYLKLDKHAIESLPVIPNKQGFAKN